MLVKYNARDPSQVLLNLQTRVIVHPSTPSQATMARGTNAYGLDARDRRFDSGCAARFFRHEISVMNHQVESEGTARFFHFEIMESPHIFFL